MNNDFELNKSFWQTNLVPKINDLNNNFVNELQNNSSYISYCQAQNDYYDSLKKYEIEHNSILYFFVCLGLFFSLILIIPFYWNWKMFKKLKNNKDHLLKIIDEQSKECRTKTIEFAKNINLIDYISGIKNLISLKRIGPITSELVNEIKQWSLFNLNFNEEINPHGTSWCVWDNNKIVIEQSQQSCIWTTRTYSGSITVPHTIWTSEGPKTSYETITRYYSHPYVEIENKNIQHFAFMKSCEDLEFQYLGKKVIKLHLSHKKAKLENDEFDSNFKWNYNNGAQFRMIFTPHKQEIFMNEYHLNNNHVSNSDALYKTSSFLYNNFNLCEQNHEVLLTLDLNKIIDNFSNDPNLDFKWLTNSIHKCINSYVYKLFESTKHLWTTPIMYSENHKNIINKAISKNYCDYYPYYILNNVIKSPIIKKDTNCFNFLLSNETCLQNSNFTIYNSKFQGTSYSYTKKIKTISGVPIEYIDCVPNKKIFNFYFIPIKYTFINENIKVQNQIIELKKSSGLEIYIDNNFIVIIPNKNISLEKINEFFNEIYKCILDKK